MRTKLATVREITWGIPSDIPNLTKSALRASGKHGKRERERERERERKFGKGRQTHICIYHHRSMLAPLLALS